MSLNIKLPMERSSVAFYVDDRVVELDKKVNGGGESNVKNCRTPS